MLLPPLCYHWLPRHLARCSRPTPKRIFPLRLVWTLADSRAARTAHSVASRPFTPRSCPNGAAFSGGRLARAARASRCRRTSTRADRQKDGQKPKKPQICVSSFDALPDTNFLTLKSPDAYVYPRSPSIPLGSRSATGPSNVTASPSSRPPLRMASRTTSAHSISPTASRAPHLFLGRPCPSSFSSPTASHVAYPQPFPTRLLSPLLPLPRLNRRCLLARHRRHSSTSLAEHFGRHSPTRRSRSVQMNVKKE